MKLIKKDREIDLPITDGCLYRNELMKEHFVRLVFDDVNDDVVEVGDYVVWEGMKYTLLKPYIPEQIEIGKYRYNVEFQVPEMLWKQKYFVYKDIDKAPETEWNMRADAYTWMQAVAKAIKLETGRDVSYFVSELIEGTQYLEIANDSIFGGLNKIAEVFDTEWWYDGDIHLGKYEQGEVKELIVGDNVNAPRVELVDDYFTRLIPLGSDRNIPQNTDAKFVNYKNRLKLDEEKYPNGYIDIEELPIEKVVPKTVIFEDIYPKSYLFIDEVKRDYDEEDKQYIYSVKLKDYTLDKDDIIEGLVPVVSFQDGLLNGREFELNVGEWLTLINQEEGGIIIPNDKLEPRKGDSIILANIKLPDEYIKDAQEELEYEALRIIARQKQDLNSYRISTCPVNFDIEMHVGDRVKLDNFGKITNTRVLAVEYPLDTPSKKNILIGNNRTKGFIDRLLEEAEIDKLKAQLKKGKDGNSVTLKGKLDSTDKLPTNPKKGDSYWIGTVLYTWNGIDWVTQDLQGEHGTNGSDGSTPYIGYNGNWWIGDKDLGIKAEGEDGKNGINGTNGIDGSSQYFHVKYSKNASGNPMQTSPSTYIGTFVSDNPQAPSDYQSYNWIRLEGAQGKDGEDGIPGKDGESGKTSYLHIKYSNDGKTFTNNNGEIPGFWIGQYVDFEEKDSLNFSDYTWTKIRGEDGNDGTPGKNGINGTNGIDGSSSYFHVRYSDNASGNPMKDTPAPYIGTFVSDKKTPSPNHTDYTWVRIEGAQGKDGENGIPGKDGENGKTSYLHIKYSNDGETFTENNGETPGSWIGQYVDFEEKDSSVFYNYKWKKVEGVDGDTPYIKNGNWWIGDRDTGVKAKGQDGADGKDGADGYTPYIENGYWYINGQNTGFVAKGEDGEDGSTPYIGYNGNWFIDGQDTGMKSTGETGPITYIAGLYNDSVTYKGTITKRPVVYQPYNDLVPRVGSYYFLKSIGEFKGKSPKDHPEVWEKADEFNVILTDTLVAHFAKVGGAVFYGDLMMSQWGTDASGNQSSNYDQYPDNFTPYFMVNYKTGEFVAQKGTLKGHIDAYSGTIGGFEIDNGRIGAKVDPNDDNAFGNLAMYKDFLRVGGSNGYVMLGDNVIPSIVGDAFTATGRIVNNKPNKGDFGLDNANYGLFVEVEGANKNYGIKSNAPLLAPAFVRTGVKTLQLTGDSYDIDLSLGDLFVMRSNGSYNVNLPKERTVAYQFGMNSMPNEFAFIFRIKYIGGGGRVNIKDVYNFNGNISDFALENGDVVELMGYKSSGSFAYYALNYRT